MRNSGLIAIMSDGGFKSKTRLGGWSYVIYHLDDATSILHPIGFEYGPQSEMMARTAAIDQVTIVGR